MFGLLLYNLRNQGISRDFAVADLNAGSEIWSCYPLRRVVWSGNIFCSSHEQFDAYDVAFSATFNEVGVLANIRRHTPLVEKDLDVDAPLERPDIDIEDLWEEFYSGCKNKKKSINWFSLDWNGWKSPFGHSGRASHGIRVGGASKNRSAVSIASQGNGQI